MAYTPTVWKNGEFPPIDAEHLNKIEQGIANSAPGGFGLGWGAKALTSSDDVNDIAASGWYSWYERSVPKNAINLSWVTIMRVDGHLGGVFVQTAYGVTDAINYYTQPIVARRMRDSSAIGEWEYENPPMELGIEYRTTERYLGKPVYVKLVDCGKFPPPGNSVLVAHGISNCYPVSITARMSNGNTVPFVSKYTIGADGVNIFLESKSGVSDQSANTTVALMRYTKTTD